MRTKSVITQCSMMALAAVLATSPAFAADKTKVALVLPAEINDLSWNQRAYEAAKKLSDEGKIKFAYSEAVKPDATTLDPIVAGYAQQGYQLIVTHSFTYGKTVARMSGQFADVNFAWPGGIGQTADNLADYDQPFYQGYYLAGVLAGGMTESGVIGAVTGFDIPVCHASMVAFEAGAKSVKSNIKVLSTVTGNFVDVAKAKQAALALADQGADYFMSCGQGVTLGTIEAAKERNLGATSYVGDMSSLAPKNVFASVVWNLDVLLDKMVADVVTNSFRPGKAYSFGVPEGGISVTVHPDFHKQPSAETIAAFDKALADIKSGALKVAFVPK